VESEQLNEGPKFQGLLGGEPYIETIDIKAFLVLLSPLLMVIKPFRSKRQLAVKAPDHSSRKSLPPSTFNGFHQPFPQERSQLDKALSEDHIFFVTSTPFYSVCVPFYPKAITMYFLITLV